MLDFLIEHGQSVATVLFFAVFMSFVVWVAWPGQAKKFKSYADIPFKSGDEV